MSKNKLAKFAEMETFSNVFQCPMCELETSPVLQMKGKWRTEYFHNDNPIVLELGCGRGEYTVGLARQYPEKNFIGIDIKGARMWAGAKEATLDGITNAAFLRTNIEMLEHFFDADEVDEIWLTFPDPQMKKATKRLTSTFFMSRYQHFLRNNAIIHLKTDSNFMFTYTCEMVKANNFEVLASTDDLYSSNIKDHCYSLKTHYEKQWLERGLTIKYIAFLLPHQEQYTEPDVEIEKDTYRSYGRNYNTANIRND